MGASSSKIETDKALQLCRERKRFVRQALDGRCSLAAAHVSYIQSLRNTGIALRKFVEPEVPSDSSLYTSTSATPEPLALTDKSASQISNSSPLISQHVETVESFSPLPSPLTSARFQVNHMKAVRSFSRTVKEKPPTPVNATVQAETSTPKGTASHADDSSIAETPPPPGTPPWDYFELFHPIDNQFSFQDGTGLNLGVDNADDLKRLREEEGIPELEEEGEIASMKGRDDFADSEDDFDHPSAEPLVRIFKNRNDVSESNLAKESPANLSSEYLAPESEERNGEKSMIANGTHEPEETTPLTPPKATRPAPAPVLPLNGHDKALSSTNKHATKDFMSCMREIEYLFLKASESGKEVPRMLEANKVNFRPLFTEDKAHRSKASSLLTSCFGCCVEQVRLPDETGPNEMKYLTWHRSASSLSSSSRNLIGATSNDNADDLNDNIFSSICMNSGSHASTLDRLYAWERKLYDEVKASGIIRRDYDMKCRLLRHQETRGETHKNIDKTRATVKDLHSRIIVAIHRIDSISKKIEELRDQELQPQLEELIGGLTRMWEMMLNCYKHQHSIVSLSSNSGSTRISISSESHRQATILLEFELNSLCSSFTKWISAHKSYLEAINGWLLKCVFPLRHNKGSRRKRVIEFSPRRDRAPPIFVTCGDWLKILNDLPTSKVEDAIRDLVVITNHYLPHQEKGHGKKNFSFSLSKSSAKSEEQGEDIRRNEAPVDVNLNHLRSGLVVLLDQLKSFAESAVMKYADLHKSIDAARVAYER